jgi:hypothetical protein
MGQYLLVIDKWDTYAVNNPNGVEYAAVELLRKRVDDGFWYYGETAEAAAVILKEFDEDSSQINAHDALEFLLDRSDAEYEYVEVKENGF